VSQVAIGIGDLTLAYQCLKIAISVCPTHAEAFNNLGVLEGRKENHDQARAFFRVGQKEGDHTFEPYFNGALLAFKLGDFAEAFDLCAKALNAYPEHTESLDLMKQLKTHFAML
jgi:tetratricopeptide repeat protein 8